LTIRSLDAQSPAITALADLPGARDLAVEVELLMGGRNRQRFVKRSAEHGRLDLLSVEWAPSKSGAEGRLIKTQEPHWDKQTFGSRCAGCHATAVDSAKQTFAAISLDCFVCHGEVPDGHTTQRSLVLLSSKRRDSAAVVTSICAQCHARTGISKSSRLPYPNHFVAGDNLFRDFQVDLSAGAIAELNPADRHVQENVRDVVLLGKDSVTCLTCHSVHEQTAKKHRDVPETAICANCHAPESKRVRVPYVIKSATCGY
jgi:predicted CXXCH cytochrome family protein